MNSGWVAANMTLEALSRTDDQWLHVLTGRPEHARLLARYQLSERAVARVVRGQKMRTLPRLFDEVSAVLQFPEYFGENWAALSDCIEDMSWLPGDSYILIFTNADQTLAEEPEHELRVLVKTLARAAHYWTTADPPGGRAWRHGPLPFHVVFQVAEHEADRLAHRLSAMGWPPSSLNRLG
jgi:RNAse (barnase) inhibitor barstar